MKVKNRIVATLLIVLLLSNMIPVKATTVWPDESWQDSGIPDTQWFTDQSAEGKGTSSNPYLIDTASELAGLASLVNTGSKFANQYIKLEADIDLGGKEWVSIGTNDNRFYGVFDGGGHIISNLTMYAETQGFNIGGLFGELDLSLSSCGIKNLGVVNVNIDGGIYFGGALAGAVYVDGYSNTAAFENCFSSGNLSSSNTMAYLGGLFGEVMLINATNSSMQVSNSYSTCNVSATCTDNDEYYSRYVGGLIGHIQHFGGSNVTLAVSNSYSASKVSSANLDRSYIGGFVGYANTSDQITMTNCMFDVQAAGVGYGFSGQGASIGGVEGKLTSAMTGTGGLPTGWSTSIWQTENNLYPGLTLFSGNDSAVASTIPLFLYENVSNTEFSDTRINVRHSFTVPELSQVTWSTEPSGIIDINGDTATFTSPANDAEVTVTAAFTSGAKQEFTVLCKSGVDPGDTTSPDITIGAITPSDLSADIAITSDETADIYLLVKPSSEAAPNAGDIITDGSTIKKSGTGITVSVDSLANSTNYTVYVIGVDATGNVSGVISKNFTTLADQTPPHWTSYSNVTLNGGIASADFSFDEEGMFKYVILPKEQPFPSKEQVEAGEDASGSPAYYSGEQAYTGSYASVETDISGFAPGDYRFYLVCIDSYGNISDIVYTDFALSGKVTFTVTNGSDPVEGAQVTVGSETKTTDIDGEAGFTLGGGEFTYQITAEGYEQLSDTFEMDLQEKYINITLEEETAPIIDAAISPESANYDLSAPADVSTNIIWNSANSVTDVTYGALSLTAPEDYVVSGSALTIKSDLIESLGLSAGEEAEFEIQFDTGNAAVFTINITDNYIPSDNADLSDLTVDNGTLPDFDPDIYNYSVELPYGTQNVLVGATADSPFASLDITQAASLPGTATVTVTAEDTITTKTYTINFSIGGEVSVPVESIAVSGAGGVSAVEVGNTLQMQAEVLPQNSTIKDVTWSIESGSGANISTDGLLTATGAGTVTVLATAQDGSGVYGEKVITIVNPSSSNKILLGIAVPSPITGIANGSVKTASGLGLPATVILATDFGNVNANVNWDVASSSYNPSVTNSQTFDVEGSITLPAGVINPAGVPLNINVSVTVMAAESSPSGTAPVITTASLPNGKKGSSYSQTLAATGDAPIVWSLYSGSLPDGLILSSEGLVSGNPNVTGTFNFAAKAVNNAGSDTKAFSIVINAASQGGSTGGNSSGSTGNTSSTETREVAVQVGDGTKENEAVQIPITRTISSDGSITDSVQFSVSQAAAATSKAKETESPFVTIDTSLGALLEADISNLAIPSASTSALSQNNLGLNLITGPVSLQLPSGTLSALNSSDVNITVSEITDSQQIAATKGLLLQLAAGAKTLSNPVSIVTNYGQRTQITLPIDSSLIPTEASELEEFISSLAVLVEHSDGETRLQKGNIQYDENGKPVAVSIWVDKFSTFTLVQTSFNGTEKVLKNKQMPDKVLSVKLNGDIDAKTVTEDNVYVLDQKGNKIDTVLECNGGTIKVKSVNFYSAGETYTLFITKNVLYKTGSSIENARKYTFTIGNVSLKTKEIKEYSDVSTTKVWKVNLAKKIDAKKLSSKNITVVDQYSNKVDVTLTVTKDNYLQIKPKKAYKSGQTYYIIIKEVVFTDGTKMSKEKCIKFTVK